ncbi:MAG: alginate lyase family protein [Phycisphaerales bacterium]|nr:alginate lyase family protein [Phycisphaerales bacterium]
MNPLRMGYYIMRHLGPRVVTLRASIYLSKTLGLTQRRFAERPWATMRLHDILCDGIPSDKIAYADFKRSQPAKFLFPLGEPPRVPAYIHNGVHERQPSFAERLRLLAEDRCVYFFRMPSPTPVDWSVNALDNRMADPEGDWFRIPSYLETSGDLRTLWEPARAAWAIDLARAPAHGFTGDAGELFWRWVDSFMDACPPYKTVQWKCGQESTVRFIAIVLGFWSLAHDRSTTPKRYTQIARLAWATGHRIFHHINYAISQKNNHATSEACGLILISQLFPELEGAAKWGRRGRKVLEREVLRQVYADGTYVQQSMNYHRVMLQGALLSLRLAEIVNNPFPRAVYDKLADGAEFLFQMMDPATGRLPNYGNNDGAWMLPLSECDFTDFRPTLQAVSYLCHRRRMLPAGPWDEDMLWLFGPEAVMTEDVPPRRPVSAAFANGGYYTLRQGESWAMTRCHTYRDRVAHNDALHVDLWWRGQNVLQDCGTYQYYVPNRPDIEAYFKEPTGQNTVEIDDVPAIESVSRFLFLPWTRAEVIDRNVAGDGAIWLTGELYDYDRRPWRVLHRRTTIALSPTLWIIVDDLIGTRKHNALVRWHMLDAPYKIKSGGDSVHLTTPKGDVYLGVTMPAEKLSRFEVIRGRKQVGEVQGFAAPYYGELQPIPTVEAEYSGPLQARMLTYLGLGQPVSVRRPQDDRDAQHWRFATPLEVHDLTLAGPFRPIKRVVLDHQVREATKRPTSSHTAKGGA